MRSVPVFTVVTKQSEIASHSARLLFLFLYSNVYRIVIKIPAKSLETIIMNTINDFAINIFYSSRLNLFDQQSLKKQHYCIANFNIL